MFSFILLLAVIFAFSVEAQPSSCNYKTQDLCESKEAKDANCVWYVLVLLHLSWLILIILGALAELSLPHVILVNELVNFLQVFLIVTGPLVVTPLLEIVRASDFLSIK